MLFLSLDFRRIGVNTLRVQFALNLARKTPRNAGLADSDADYGKQRGKRWFPAPFFSATAWFCLLVVPYSAALQKVSYAKKVACNEHPKGRLKQNGDLSRILRPKNIILERATPSMSLIRQ